MVALAEGDIDRTRTRGATAGSGRRRILDTSAELFVAKGYAETSVRDIAAEIGIKAGSIYYHVSSKDELFVELLEEGIGVMIDAFDTVAERLSEPVRRRSAAGSDDPVGAEARFEAHVAAHLEALHHNHPITTLHVTTFRTAPPDVRRAVVPIRDAYESKWSELLSELLPERPADEVAILRLSLFGSLNSSIDWFDATRGNLDEFSAVVAENFWRGATAAPASNNARSDNARSDNTAPDNDSRDDGRHS